VDTPARGRVQNLNNKLVLKNDTDTLKKKETTNKQTVKLQGLSGLENGTAGLKLIYRQAHQA
jgi:hypothetical protein